MNKLFFVTGIDTGTGKSIVTGLLAGEIKKNVKNTITQKLVQTGCKAPAEDIETHRKLMNMPLTDDDLSGLTCPYVFDYPASPHLAAKLQNTEIDVEKIKAATEKLSQKYEVVLLEGAGGLYVPINPDYTIIDHIERQKYPVILVSSSKLGSINHTLLSLDALKNRKIELKALIYNHYPCESREILADSSEILKFYLKKFYPDALFTEIPIVSEAKKNVFDSDFIKKLLE